MRVLAAIACCVLLLAACDDDRAPSGDHAGAGSRPVPAGIEAFRQQQYDQAIAHYQKALEEQPGRAEVYNLLGMAYRFKYNRDLEPALKEREIRAFQKAVELNPEFVVALVNLGSSYYYSGNKQRAARVFERALAIMPDHPEAAQLKDMIRQARDEDPPEGEDAHRTEGASD